MQPYNQQPGHWNANTMPQQPQHHPPPPRHHVGAGEAAAGGGGDSVRTLWIGDLQHWMDDNYLTRCFYQTGELSSAKVIRNQQTNQSEGYGFLTFTSHAAAVNVFQTYNGTKMLEAEQSYRLQLAADDSPNFVVYVGDLAADVSDNVLKETFRYTYQSVKSANVVRDMATGRSMGYGFVTFNDERELERAIEDMHGYEISGMEIKIKRADQRPLMPASVAGPSFQNQPPAGESSDVATIFVGGIDFNVTTPADLRQIFSQYGEVVNATIPLGKFYGFVKFSDRASAQRALNSNIVEIRERRVTLSWAQKQK